MDSDDGHLHLPGCDRFAPNCVCKFLLRYEKPSKASDKDDELLVQSVFDQLFWTLKHIQFNPMPKVNKESLEVLGDLCSGVDDIVNLSQLRFSDKEYQRLLFIVRAMTSFIKSFEGNITLTPLIRLRTSERIEILLDNFLDEMSRRNISAMEQLVCQGYVNGVLMQFQDLEVRKLFVEKLVLRIRDLTSTFWRVLIYKTFPKKRKGKSKPKKMKFNDMMILDPEDINLFYFYCQFLEVTVTLTETAGQGWIEEPVYNGIFNLDKDSNTLFQMLPLLTFALYPVLVAMRQALVQKKIINVFKYPLRLESV